VPPAPGAMLSGKLALTTYPESALAVLIISGWLPPF